MKKSILSISILTATVALADNFVVVVNKEQNTYKSGEIIVSDWSEVSNDCTVDIEAESIYFGIPFNQIKTCSLKESRTITEISYDTEGNENKTDRTEERMTVVVEDPLSVLGVHLESSCQNIILNGYSSSNGYFKIKREDKEPTVFCDMENGGWTFYLIPNNSQNDWHNINWDTGWHPVPSLNINNYSDLENKCSSETGLPVFADYQTTNETFWHVGREFLKSETNWFDTPEAGDGGGVALGLKWSGDRWLNMEGGEVSIISSNSSDSGDTCDGNLQICGYWDAKDNNPLYGYGSGAEDWGFSQNSAVLCGGLLKEDVYKITEEFTEWKNIGLEKNCSIAPLENEIYKNTNFDQIRTCDQEQSRTKNTYNENELTGNKVLISSNIEKQTIEIQDTELKIGTYNATSCLDIKNHGGENSNGKYSIFLNNLEETVYCDMEGGAWTLLLSTGLDEPRVNLTSTSINKNNPPTTINHSFYDYIPKIDDFIPTLNTNTIIKFTCKDREYGTERAYYHKGIDNFNTYLNISTGSYTGNVYCATNESFTDNVTSGSIGENSCIRGNNTQHRYYNAGIKEYGWAHYSSGDGRPSFLRHCGSNWIGDGANSQSQGYIWYK